MRSDWEDNLPPAGILEREELELRRYRGLNPAFVHRVWAKRREEAGVKTWDRQGGRPNAWTQGQIDEVAEMMRAGLSSGQIARKLGVTVGCVSGLVHRTPELKAIGFQTAHSKKLRERAA